MDNINTLIHTHVVALVVIIITTFTILPCFTSSPITGSLMWIRLFRHKAPQCHTDHAEYESDPTPEIQE